MRKRELNAESECCLLVGRPLMLYSLDGARVSHNLERRQLMLVKAC